MVEWKNNIGNIKLITVGSIKYSYITRDDACANNVLESVKNASTELYN